MEHVHSAQPSEDLSTLVEQLRGALALMEQGDSADPHGYRMYLWELLSGAWGRVARGDLQYIRVVLGSLAPLLGFAERHLPPAGTPTQEAALDIHCFWQMLKLGERVMARVSTEVELDNRERSPTQREILRVFLLNPRYMRRSEVHEAMNSELRPSAVRVGQILEELYSQKLLLRRTLPARGNAETGFYSLSPLGESLCQKLGIGAANDSQPSHGNELPHLSLRVERKLAQQELLEAALNGQGEQRAEHRPRWHLFAAVLRVASCLSEQQSWSVGDVYASRLLKRFPFGQSDPEGDQAVFHALAPEWPMEDLVGRDLTRFLINYTDDSNHHEMASTLTSIGDKLEPRSWMAMLWVPCAVTIAGTLPFSRKEAVMRERILDRVAALLTQWEEPFALHWRGRAALVAGHPGDGPGPSWERLINTKMQSSATPSRLARKILETNIEIKSETRSCLALLEFERALGHQLDTWVRDAFKNVPPSAGHGASTEFVDWVWENREPVHQLVQSRLRTSHDNRIARAANQLAMELTHVEEHWSTLSEGFRHLTMRYLTHCQWLLSRVNELHSSPLLRTPELATEFRRFVVSREKQGEEQEFQWLKRAVRNNLWPNSLVILETCAGPGNSQELIPPLPEKRYRQRS
ncbi:hypothetical protein ACLESD_00900 [Pyxidicoccus sp. 3LFB2]